MKRSLYYLFAALLIAGCSPSGVESSSSSDTPPVGSSSEEHVSQNSLSGDDEGLESDALGSSSIEPIAPDDTNSPQSSAQSDSVPPSVVQSIEPSAAGVSFDDLEIVPGEKFGFVTANTSRQDLVEQVGEDRLVDEEFHIGEGFMEPATAVNLDDYSFTVIWADENRTTPLEIRALGSAWQLPQDIRMGMTFAELQASLGEFQIFGLGWDYGGTVLLDNTVLDEHRETLILRMEPELGVAQTNTDDFQAVLGDRLYESTDPHFGSLNMTLDDVIVYLEPTDN